jgi:hypothetical protein
MITAPPHPTVAYYIVYPGADDDVPSGRCLKIRSEPPDRPLMILTIGAPIPPTHTSDSNQTKRIKSLPMKRSLTQEMIIHADDIADSIRSIASTVPVPMRLPAKSNSMSIPASDATTGALIAVALAISRLKDWFGQRHLHQPPTTGKVSQ